MIRRMSVLQTKVPTAISAIHSYNLLDLAAFGGALIGKDLSSTFRQIRLTVVVYVHAYRQVRRISSLQRYRNVAHWTYRHLYVFLVSAGTRMTHVRYVIGAKNRFARVASQRQKIQTIARLFGAMLAEIRQLHDFYYQ